MLFRSNFSVLNNSTHHKARSNTPNPVWPTKIQNCQSTLHYLDPPPFFISTAPFTENHREGERKRETMIPQQWGSPCNHQCTHKYSALMQIPCKPSFFFLSLPLSFSLNIVLLPDLWFPSCFAYYLHLHRCCLPLFIRFCYYACF